MLTKEKVLNHVKLNLGFPYKAIEHSDSILLEYIYTHTIPFFSNYIPDKARMVLNNENRVGENLYILNDPEGCDILSIQDLIPNASASYVAGHPIYPAFTFDDLPIFTLQVSKARMISQFIRPTFEWIPPNKLYITPSTYSIIKEYMVRYTRTHPTSFYTIPVTFQSIFLDLCTADCLDIIASIRSQYGSLNTPFGEINLNPDALISRASELRNSAVEKLNTIPPATIVEIG